MNNRLCKNTRDLEANRYPTGDRAKAAPDRHETGLFVQAEQQLLRRAAVTLHVEECGWEEDQSATEIHKKVAQLEQS